MEQIRQLLLPVKIQSNECSFYFLSEANQSFYLQKNLWEQFELPPNQRNTGTSKYSLNQTIISFILID